MKRNLYGVFYGCLIASGKQDILKQMFHELHGGFRQVIQLAGMAGNLMKQESIVANITANDLSNSILIKMIHE